MQPNYFIHEDDRIYISEMLINKKPVYLFVTDDGLIGWPDSTFNNRLAFIVKPKKKQTNK